MARRAYVLQTKDGTEYALRLNSFQLAGYLKTNFQQPTAPLVGVIQAIDRLDLLTDLLTRALRGAGDLRTGGDALFDLLVDEGYCSDDFAMLVVHIAAESGIIPAEMEGAYLDAVTVGENGAVGQARAIVAALNGRKPDGAADAEDAEDAEAGPTK